MPAHIVRNDITRMQADAIVNTANRRLSPGGGVTGAIHKAAGPQLAAACEKLGGCRVSECKITEGFALPCRYVIHTVGPMWSGGIAGEKQKLYACYANALRMAKDHGCESIAFPLISAGTFGFPKELALRIAMSAISDFLETHDMTVYVVVYGRESLHASRQLYKDVEQYIDDHYVQSHPDFARQRQREMPQAFSLCTDFCAPCAPAPAKNMSLEDALDCLDESFSQMLLRKIAEKGMKNAECYKRANIDKKLFSKIKGDVHYKPKKTTALAFCVALKLSLSETEEMLLKAGFALSHSEKFDVIVEYFITHGRYDIFKINEVLFHYDQPLLGGAIY